MSTNPFINAVAALAYIIGVASLLYFTGEYMPDPVFPVFGIALLLSVFVLSAALMGYIFLSMPITRYLDGDRKGGIKLFLQTLGAFVILVAVSVLISSFFFL